MPGLGYASDFLDGLEQTRVNWLLLTLWLFLIQVEERTGDRFVWGNYTGLGWTKNIPFGKGEKKMSDLPVNNMVGLE